MEVKIRTERGCNVVLKSKVSGFFETRKNIETPCILRELKFSLNIECFFKEKRREICRSTSTMELHVHVSEV